MDIDGTSLGLSVGDTDGTTLSSTVGSIGSVGAMLAVILGSNFSEGEEVSALVGEPDGDMVR